MQKAISYKKLFKLMIDRDLKGHDLRQMAGISQSTYCKLQHDLPVSTQMLVRICSALDCQLLGHCGSGGSTGQHRIKGR